MCSMPPALDGAVAHVRPRPARSTALSVHAPTVSSGNSGSHSGNRRRDPYREAAGRPLSLW